MRYHSLIIFLFVFATNTWANDDPLDDLKKNQPRDVKELIDRLAGYTHWGGEEPYNTERKGEIASAMINLRCDQLEKDEATVRKRYSKQPRMLNVLQQAKEPTW